MPEAFGPGSPQGVLVGLGTILDDRLPEVEGCKIVFGSGVRSLTPPACLARGWDVRFVRGPISAAVTGAHSITDPAYAVRLLPRWSEAAIGPSNQGAPIGVMPHFGSLSAAPWEAICRRTGRIFLDPTAPVEVVLASIASCSGVITEAMHGAILADAMRVPWARMGAHAWRREGLHVHGLKWMDWALSMGVDVPFAVWAEVPPPGRSGSHSPVGLLRSALTSPLRARAITRLETAIARIHQTDMRLSTDARLAEVLEQLTKSAESVRKFTQDQGTPATR